MNWHQLSSKKILTKTIILYLNEIKKYSDELGSKDRWLVFTKTDLLPKDECQATIDKCVKEINWEGPVFSVSSINKSGTEELCNNIYRYLYESDSGPLNEQENR